MAAHLRISFKDEHDARGTADTMASDEARSGSSSGNKDCSRRVSECRVQEM